MLYNMSNCCKITMCVDYSCYEAMLNLLSLEWFDSIVNELNDRCSARLSFYCRKLDLPTIWKDIKDKISSFEERYQETMKYTVTASTIEDEPTISDFMPNDFIRTYGTNLIVYELSNKDISKFSNIDNVIMVPELGNEFIINMHSYIDNIKGTLLSLDSINFDSEYENNIIYSVSNAEIYKDFILRKNKDAKISIYDDHDSFIYAIENSKNRYNVILTDLPSYIFNIRDELMLSETKSNTLIITGILNLYEHYYLDQVMELQDCVNHIYTGNWQNFVIGKFDQKKYKDIIGNGR